MALRDQPYLPLYVQDFLTDEKLMECSAEATGVYIRIMCIMHKSNPYGTILLRQKDQQISDFAAPFASKLAKHLPYSFEVILSALEELLTEEVLVIENNSLIQRRMKRDGEISIKRSLSGSKGGSKTNQKYFATANSPANSPAKVVANTENEITPTPKSKVNSKLNLSAREEIFDAESEVLKNQVEFEKICMLTGKTEDLGKEVLRKYHLHLVEKDDYPKTRKQIFAGFERWMRTEKNKNDETGQPIYRDFKSQGHDLLVRRYQKAVEAQAAYNASKQNSGLSNSGETIPNIGKD